LLLRSYRDKESCGVFVRFRAPFHPDPVVTAYSRVGGRGLEF
jgi:hypothetical protein